MGIRSADRMLVYSVIGWVAVAPMNCFAADDSHDQQHHSATDLIHDADTFYWFAMAERGSMTPIKHALQYLDDAEKRLPQEDHEAATEAAMKAEIDALRRDLEAQEEIRIVVGELGVIIRNAPPDPSCRPRQCLRPKLWNARPVRRSARSR